MLGSLVNVHVHVHVIMCTMCMRVRPYPPWSYINWGSAQTGGQRLMY
jgi:hypothetical protein